MRKTKTAGGANRAAAGDEAHVPSRVSSAGAAGHSEQPPTRELQRMSVQVEHVDDETGVQVEPIDDQNNDVADDDAHDVVQQTPPILQ